MNIGYDTIKGLRVTVMGLGLNGGGIESALFFLKRGATVTITDLKDEKTLAPSLEKLAGYKARYVLGKHEKEDFINTDMVVKNPGVPASSPFLAAAAGHNISIETDISLFLSLSKNPLIAVTGSKGKSTTASAIHHALKTAFPGAALGGNITISPLAFIDSVPADAPVVLELSSWQLADLVDSDRLRPAVSLITNIYPDHQNWYKNMDDYINDKKIIFKNQTHTEYSVFNLDCPYVHRFDSSCKASVCYFSNSLLPFELDGAWLEKSGGFASVGKRTGRILEEETQLEGAHNKMNLLSAGLVLFIYGMDPPAISKALSGFAGIEHRLELFLTHEGVRYYNDSAATIPQATAAAVKTLGKPILGRRLILITGGTDKNIDFSGFAAEIKECKRIFLLDGTAAEKLIPLLKKEGIDYCGPFSDLGKLVEQVIAETEPGDSVLFSPGCASFGMFLNEFDRGKRFKNTVMEKLGK